MTGSRTPCYTTGYKLTILATRAEVAQLVEHLTEKKMLPKKGYVKEKLIFGQEM